MTSTEDLFTPIHKGLRAMIYDLSTRFQTHDFGDTAATRSLVDDQEEDFAAARTAGCVVCVLSHHAHDEEGHIFPEVTRVGSGLISQLIEEHHDLTRRELQLAKDGRSLLDLNSENERVGAGIRLNQRANELFAAYIAHMNREDAELVPLMREHFTDEQMGAMRSAIMAGMPPERLFFILGWMLPALNVTELTTLMTSLRRSAPPPVVQAVADLGAAKVDANRWSQVISRVGL